MSTEMIAVLAGAFGAGTIAGKLLDVFLLERIAHKREHERWLRDARFRTYAEVAQYLRGFGLSVEDGNFSIVEALATVAPAVLLAGRESTRTAIANAVDALRVVSRETATIGPGGSESDDKKWVQIVRTGEAASDAVVTAFRAELLDTRGKTTTEGAKQD